MAFKVEVTPLPMFDPMSDDKQKRALLLYQAGQETQELFDTFTDTGTDYATAMTKLDTYFNPKKNVDLETFKFRQATQQEGETVDQFVTRLRKLAATCDLLNTQRPETVYKTEFRN